MNTQTFKSYSDKSSARKGAQRAGFSIPDAALQQVDGKWGFYPFTEVEETMLGTLDHDMRESNQYVLEAQRDDAADASNGALAAALEKGIEEAETEEGKTPIANGAFGAFAASQLGAQTQVADPVSTQRVVKLEKNRAERNGVKQPSAGTACANVWDTAFKLSDMSESTHGQHERIATLSQVVKAAEAAGVNKFTARTQYARWRVFHGLTGRLVQK